MEMVSGIRHLAANYRYRNMAAPKYEKGSRWFLGQHPVVVVRCYEVFQLVRIRYEDEDVQNPSYPRLLVKLHELFHSVL